MKSGSQVIGKRIVCACVAAVLPLIWVGCGSNLSWEERTTKAEQARVEGRLAEAETLLRKALEQSEEFPEGDPRRISSLNMLGQALLDRDQPQEAVQLFRRALDLKEKDVGPDDLTLANSYTNLALHYRSAGQLDESEAFLQKAVDLRRRIQGDSSPDLAMSLNNLGTARILNSDLIGAEEVLQEARRIVKVQLGAEHPNEALILENLGTIHRDRDEFELARAAFRRAGKIWHLNGNNDRVALTRQRMGEVFQREGNLVLAEQYFREAIEIHEIRTGGPGEGMAGALSGMAGLLREQRRFEDAERMYRQAIEVLENERGFMDPDLAAVLYNLGRLFMDQDRYDDAELLFEQSLDMYAQTIGENNASVARVLDSYSDLLHRTQRANKGRFLSGMAAQIRAEL